MARTMEEGNWLIWNQGKSPLVNFNFMLRVELLFDLPCKSVRAFTREMEYELIQEGGLNDYVHMRRKPISKPFTLEVERYVGVDYVDPMPLGGDLALPVILFVGRAPNQFIPGLVARTYVFTGCTVMKKVYGELVGNQSGLLVETTTLGYREMLVVNIPWSEAAGVVGADVQPSLQSSLQVVRRQDELERLKNRCAVLRKQAEADAEEAKGNDLAAATLAAGLREAAPAPSAEELSRIDAYAKAASAANQLIQGIEPPDAAPEQKMIAEKMLLSTVMSKAEEVERAVELSQARAPYAQVEEKARLVAAQKDAGKTALEALRRFQAELEERAQIKAEAAALLDSLTNANTGMLTLADKFAVDARELLNGIAADAPGRDEQEKHKQAVDEVKAELAAKDASEMTCQAKAKEINKEIQKSEKLSACKSAFSRLKELIDMVTRRFRYAESELEAIQEAVQKTEDLKSQAEMAARAAERSKKELEYLKSQASDLVAKVAASVAAVAAAAGSADELNTALEAAELSEAQRREQAEYKAAVDGAKTATSGKQALAEASGKTAVDAAEKSAELDKALEDLKKLVEETGSAERAAKANVEKLKTLKSQAAAAVDAAEQAKKELEYLKSQASDLVAKVAASVAAVVAAAGSADELNTALEAEKLSEAQKQELAEYKTAVDGAKTATAGKQALAEASGKTAVDAVEKSTELDKALEDLKKLVEETGSAERAAKANVEKLKTLKSQAAADAARRAEEGEAKRGTAAAAQAERLKAELTAAEGALAGAAAAAQAASEKAEEAQAALDEAQAALDGEDKAALASAQGRLERAEAARKEREAASARAEEAKDKLKRAQAEAGKKHAAAQEAQAQADEAKERARSAKAAAEAAGKASQEAPNDRALQVAALEAAQLAADAEREAEQAAALAEERSVDAERAGLEADDKIAQAQTEAEQADKVAAEAGEVAAVYEGQAGRLEADRAAVQAHGERQAAVDEALAGKQAADAKAQAAQKEQERAAAVRDDLKSRIDKAGGGKA